MADKKKKNPSEKADSKNEKVFTDGAESLDETVDNTTENAPEADKTAEDVSAEGNDNNAEDTDATEAKEKKGLFGKSKESKAEEKYKAEISELNDKLVRQLAEFENFRNRTQKEKEAMFETGAKSVIEKILPVVDNFERGIQALSEDEKENSFAKGMIGIYKQLVSELEKIEVQPIDAVGKEFDPNLHNAVMQTQSEEFESGVVAQELQKGYTYRGQVVRHSMVAVVE